MPWTIVGDKNKVGVMKEEQPTPEEVWIIESKFTMGNWSRVVQDPALNFGCAEEKWRESKPTSPAKKGWCVCPY